MAIDPLMYSPQVRNATMLEWLWHLQPNTRRRSNDKYSHGHIPRLASSYCGDSTSIKWMRLPFRESLTEPTRVFVLQRVRPLEDDPHSRAEKSRAIGLGCAGRHFVSPSVLSPKRSLTLVQAQHFHVAPESRAIRNLNQIRTNPEYS
jgi:hypothetical protein